MGTNDVKYIPNIKAFKQEEYEMLNSGLAPDESEMLIA